MFHTYWKSSDISHSGLHFSENIAICLRFSPQTQLRILFHDLLVDVLSAVVVFDEVLHLFSVLAEAGIDWVVLEKLVFGLGVAFMALVGCFWFSYYLRYDRRLTSRQIKHYILFLFFIHLPRFLSWKCYLFIFFISLRRLKSNCTPNWTLVVDTLCFPLEWIHPVPILFLRPPRALYRCQAILYLFLHQKQLMYLRW